MAVQGKIKAPQRTQISAVERLTLRVSSMINHPIAQDRKWAKIHRLDTDGDREWDEVMSVLAEVDGIEMTFNDEDESVTLSWEAPDDEDPRVEDRAELDALEQPAPF
jgi:hypothetical protein